MTLKVIFIKRIETYKRMSVSCSVQALRISQSLSIAWKSMLIFVQIQLHWCYVISWFVVVYYWLKKIMCLSVSKGEYVMTKAYLVDVLSWLREGMEQWENNLKKKKQQRLVEGVVDLVLELRFSLDQTVRWKIGKPRDGHFWIIGFCV